MTADPVSLFGPEQLVRLTVLDKPVAQGTLHCIGARGKRQHTLIMSNDKDLRAWRGRIAGAARRRYTGEPLKHVALEIRAAWTLELPASAPKNWLEHAEWRYPCKRPDGDKLQRAIFDALTGVVVVDDGQFVRFSGVKLYVGHPHALPEPGVRIEVWTMP